MNSERIKEIVEEFADYKLIYETMREIGSVGTNISIGLFSKNGESAWAAKLYNVNEKRLRQTIKKLIKKFNETTS